MRKSSMADVAKLAGVSTATVSHVINNTRFVSPEISCRVKEAIKQLSYVPNQLARNLKAGCNHTILFIVPDISNAFFASVIKGAETSLEPAGYRLIVADSDENPEQEQQYIQFLNTGIIDGLLLASTMESWKELGFLFQNNLPLVLVDRHFDDAPFSSVYTESSDAISKAVHSLAAAGHKNIGFIGGLERITTTKNRFQAYCAAISDCQLQKEFVFWPSTGNFTQNAKYCCEALFSQGCTAFVVSNGMMSHEVMYYCYESGHFTGHGFDIIGYCDSSFYSYAADYFAVIRQPSEKIGRLAGKEILRLIAKPEGKPRSVCVASVFDPLK